MWLVLPYTVGVAILMVSRIPTYSGKTLGSRVSREYVLPLLGLAAIAVVCLFTFTWQMLTVLSILYLAMIPLGIRSYRRDKAAYEAQAFRQERRSEHLIEIGADILGILDSDREAEHAVAGKGAIARQRLAFEPE